MDFTTAIKTVLIENYINFQGNSQAPSPITGCSGAAVRAGR
jgi:hypothetical protein